jgi:hypothetical protein
MRSCLRNGTPAGWSYSAYGPSSKRISVLRSRGRKISAWLVGGGDCGRVLQRSASQPNTSIANPEPESLHDALARSAARQCKAINEQNFYRLRTRVKGLSCSAAVGIYRKTSVPRWAVVVEYRVWGRSFSNKGWTCRYRRMGLAGSEHDLRCSQAARSFTVTRRQDGA